MSEWLTHAQSTLQASVDGTLPALFGTTRRTPQDALRLAYRGLLAQLAARDLAGDAVYVEVAAALSDLAVAVLDAGVAIARNDLGARADGADLGVVAMGKCGGHELNYVSDVDVVFVSGPGEVGSRAATAVATQMMRAISGQTGAGTIWQVDAALRPEGKSGPLVRTLDSFRNYYERWAKTWEFQAMLKARPAAGDLALSRRLVQTVRPMVWQAADRPGFVEDAQAMRRRVIEHLGDDPEREIKLDRAACVTSSSPSSCSSLCTDAPTSRFPQPDHPDRARRPHRRRLHRPRRRRRAQPRLTRVTVSINPAIQHRKLLIAAKSGVVANCYLSLGHAYEYWRWS